MKQIASVFLALCMFLSALPAGAVLVDSYRYIPSFVPTSISGMVLWLDASDTSTITASSNLVSQWNDKSGTGNNFTQGTGSRQPSSGTRTLAGLNTVDYTGDDYMMGPSGLYSISAGPNTIFIVYASDNTVTDQRMLSGSDDATNSRLMARFNGNTAVEGRNTSVTTSATVSRTSDTVAHVFVLQRSGLVISVYHDGGVAGTGVASDVTLTSLVMGASPGLGTGFFDGRIVEIGIYNSAISTANMNLYGAYLAGKWGFTWTTI